MKITLLSSSHTPDDDRIFFKEARSLSTAYGGITLVSPFPEKVPADKAGVSFVCFERRGGLLGRIGAIVKIHRLGLQLQADVYHCHEPESLLVGISLKRRIKCRVIYDSHELWQGVVEERLPRPLSRLGAWLFGKIEQCLVRQCDAVIGATPPITDHLARMLRNNNYVTLLNVPLVDIFGQVDERRWDETTIICHDGYLSFERGLKTIAEAIRIAAAKHRIVFKIVGDVFGEERIWLDEFVRRHSLQNIIVRTGWLPYAEVGRALAPCHIGLVAFHKCRNHVVAAPNKIYNYLLYGIPVIGPDFILTLQQMAVEDQCCVLADPTSPESYAGAICRMIEDRAGTQRMSANAARASREKYRWEHMAPKLLALYDRVLSGTGSSERVIP